MSSLTLQTASHNAAMLADLDGLHSLPSLVDLRLLHHREPGLPTAPVLMQRLPERLTSLRMQDWGCRANEQSLNVLLAGAICGCSRAGDVIALLTHPPYVTSSTLPRELVMLYAAGSSATHANLACSSLPRAPQARDTRPAFCLSLCRSDGAAVSVPRRLLHEDGHARR